jgi:hypothetical protein
MLRVGSRVFTYYCFSSQTVSVSVGEGKHHNSTKKNYWYPCFSAYNIAAKYVLFDVIGGVYDSEILITVGPSLFNDWYPCFSAYNIADKFFLPRPSPFQVLGCNSLLLDSYEYFFNGGRTCSNSLSWSNSRISLINRAILFLLINRLRQSFCLRFFLKLDCQTPTQWKPATRSSTS